MFDFDGNLKFVNVDLMYLKHLHKACSEVFYKPDDYDNKPYIGLFVSQENRKYVIPPTSAKNKHKTWKDSYPDRFLIYAFENKDYLPSGAIYNEMGNGMVKHISQQFVLGHFYVVVIIWDVNYKEQIVMG